jgi:DNA-binding transcriptional LysR family regulator
LASATASEIRLDLTLRDRLVDPIAEGLDLVVRVGSLGESSSLIARRLSTIRLVFCAAPSYLRRHGTPRSLPTSPATSASAT